MRSFFQYEIFHQDVLAHLELRFRLSLAETIKAVLIWNVCIRGLYLTFTLWRSHLCEGHMSFVPCGPVWCTGALRHLEWEWPLFCSRAAEGRRRGFGWAAASRSSNDSPCVMFHIADVPSHLRPAVLLTLVPDCLTALETVQPDNTLILLWWQSEIIPVHFTEAARLVFFMLEFLELGLKVFFSMFWWCNWSNLIVHHILRQHTYVHHFY